MNESLYDILGVKSNASDDEIRKAYRALARELHPDVNPDDKAAEDRFKRVTVAYNVLSDSDKRKDYDEFGDDSLRGGFDAEKARAYKNWADSQRHRGPNPFDPGTAHHPFAGGSGPNPGFEFDIGDLFGFGRRASGPMRGGDIRAVVDMDLPQAIAGGKVEIRVPHNKKPVVVKIPPGADNGSTIRLAGKGAPGERGGLPGDLIIETRVKPHPRVSRKGLDLTISVPVSLSEAYNGASIEVPTFSGPVMLKVPPRSQPGAKLRLRGKGVARKKKRGDLLVVLDVVLPDQLDDELASAIDKSDASYTRPPRAGFSL